MARYLAITGGVGGAKLALGLAKILGPEECFASGGFWLGPQTTCDMCPDAGRAMGGANGYRALP